MGQTEGAAILIFLTIHYMTLKSFIHSLYYPSLSLTTEKKLRFNKPQFYLKKDDVSLE